MILAEVELENYKQFAGAHRFQPSPQGVIAVYGPNGAGKTTLFEAIEWCLYNPRRIENDSIRPHHFPGNPRVRVVLEDPVTGERTVVVRVLKRSGAEVSIYPEAEPERLLATGAAPAAAYIGGTLIGLPHKAFEATIFTRQKELGFFTGLRPAERREEVARLLGLAAIRKAQEAIQAFRTNARNLGKSKRQLYRQESDERDFPAELAVINLDIAGLSEVTWREEQVLERSQATRAAATSERTGLQTKQLADIEHERRIGDLGHERVMAAERRQNAAVAIQQIAAQEAARPALFATVEQIPLIETALHRFEADLQRLQTRDRNQQTIDSSNRKLKDSQADIERFVAGHPLPGFDAWRWQPVPLLQTPEVLAALLEIANSCDPVPAERLASGLNAALEQDRLCQQETTTLSDYQERLTAYKAELDNLLVAGDAEVAVATARTAGEAARSDADKAQARIDQLQPLRQRNEEQIKRLRTGITGDVCPTCGRPFSESDQGLSIQALQENVVDNIRQITEGRQLLTGAEQRLALAKRTEADEQERANRATDLRSRITNGEVRVAEQEEKSQRCQAQLRDLLAVVDRTTLPTADEVESAVARAAQLATVASSVNYLGSLSTQVIDAIANHNTAAQQLADADEVTYDQAEHDRQKALLRQSQTATGTLLEIDRAIARKPEYQQTVAANEATLKRLDQDQQALNTERTALGFDAAALLAAQQAESAAHESELTAQKAHDAAAHALQAKERDRVQLEQWRDHVQGLLDDAIAQEAAADRFDDMAKAMVRFDAYVATRVTPELAEMASSLLSDITEGKYSEIAFDDNYGIRVKDEQDEPFPLETYSGGERDVVALSARLALSQFIGSQAVNQPRFVVLDEVFGSLDQERRTNVLNMLTSLISDSGVFRQIFVISHVDDVKQATLDEVWKVSETASGASQVELFDALTTVEDF